MFISLANRQHDEISDKLKRMLKSIHLKNIFNPSFVTKSARTIIAFRAINPEINKINSYIATFGQQEQLIDLMNLSNYVEQFNISNASDPKIFLEGDANIWITFNTGYSKDYNNIYILKFYPEVGQPICCDYEKRQRVEKNWAFFFEDNKILALYSITPLIVLEAFWPCTESNVCEFRERMVVSENQPKTSLSIGTQLIPTEKGYVFIAHRKITFFSKRMYYGIPVILQKDDIGYHLSVQKKMRLIHSMASLLGSKIKHNKNLLSCTYFSGISPVADNHLVVGYGINDVDFSFALLKTI